jgi:hypothetical protein
MNPQSIDPSRLWLALLAAPLAWVFQLTVVFALSAWSTERENFIPLHLVSGTCFIVSLASIGFSWNFWRTVGGWPDGSEPPDVARIRSLTVLGMLAGVLFSCVIVAQWLAVAMLPHSMGAG